MRRSYDAPFPAVDVLDPEKSDDSVEQCCPAWLWKSDQKQTAVSSRYVLSGVRKIQVLGDEETAVAICGLPDDVVILAGEAFVSHGVDVVPELSQERDEPVR
jgi:hypothetical protein